MNLTILPRWTLSLAVLLLAAPTWTGATTDHKLRARFHPVDCERWLAQNVRSLRRDLLGGFVARPLISVGVERVGVGAPPLIDLAREDEEFVWFTAEDGDGPREIAARLNRLNAERKEFPDRSAFDYDPAKFDPNAPLTGFEKEALGLDYADSVGPRGVRGQALATSEGWRIDWRIRGTTVGGIELPTRDAQIGYSNAVYEFQWDEVTTQRRRGVQRLRWPTIPDFMRTNGHALWLRTREATGQRFGYALRGYELGPEKWTYQLEVYKVRATPRQAASPADIVFPGAFAPPFGAPQPQVMNLQLIDLGLRLPLDPIRARE